MWIVTWKFNGVTHVEKYDMYQAALDKFDKLIDQRQRPSIHQRIIKELEDEKPERVRQG